MPGPTELRRVSARLGAIAESATLAVDAKAKALKAQGQNVIGFGAGEPDFPTPAHVVEAAIKACSEVKYHRYTPAAGLPELREAIAVKTMRDSGFSCTADQVLVTNGGKHAVFTAFAALCDPGDEIICPAPFWTTYPEAITLAGGVAKIIDTDEVNGFRVTVEQLDAALTPRTKETYAMTGWRVGWMIGPKDIMKASINFQSHSTSNVSNVAQMAALAAVSGDLSAVYMMREAFERRGKLMHKMLTSIPGVTCMEPQGAFYCYPNFSALLNRDIRGKKAATTLELADLILNEVQVAIVPGEAFGTPGFARFSFALGDDDLGEGVQRIIDLVS